MRTTMGLALILLSILGANASASEPATRPDFSGHWILDRDRSDDAVAMVWTELEEGLARGRKQMRQRFLAETLVERAKASAEVEIRHSDRDIVVFDRADDLAIYYIDGKKHKRQDQSLGDFETVAEWRGSQLVVESQGSQAGSGVQVFFMDGEHLVVSRVWKPKHFKNPIAATFYYQRVEERRGRSSSVAAGEDCGLR